MCVPHGEREQLELVEGTHWLETTCSAELNTVPHGEANCARRRVERGARCRIRAAW